MTPHPVTHGFMHWASTLRWPQLFFLAAGLFVIDLIVPDFIPLIDEILLALLTLLFAAWRRRRPVVYPPRFPGSQG